MHHHITPVCSICRKPVADGECWRNPRTAEDPAHVLCICAAILLDDSPARLDHEIADEVNARSEEFCAMLCENPLHRDVALQHEHYLVATCDLCHGVIDFDSDFFFEVAPEILVHPGCLMLDQEGEEVNDGAVIAHTCGEVSCVNPAHLQITYPEVK